MTEEIRNTGFNPELEEQDHDEENDWVEGDEVLGAKIPTGIANEVAGLVTALYAWPRPINGIYRRTKARINHCIIFFQEKLKHYFPTGQLQNRGEEKMYCVTGGFNNEIEKQLNWAYQNSKLHDPFIDFLKEYNFFDKEGKIRLSNRIPALGSGTTRNGNSLKRVAEWIRKNGIFPQNILPEDYPMSFDEYYDPSKITSEMLKIGQKSKEFLTFNYAIVKGTSNYPKYAGDVRWEIFDNYLDVDGDFIKRLAPDYILMNYAYKVILNETKPFNTKPINNNELMKTLKSQTDKRVFIKSNTDDKTLIWLGGKEGDATYTMLKKHGLVNEQPDEVISDALLPSYNIESGIVKVDYDIEEEQVSWFTTLIEKIKSNIK